MITHSTKLLRRTLAVVGASLLLAAAAPVLAQGTVTLSGTAGNSCTYSQMTVTPNGTISVACSGTTATPTTVANFSVTTAQSTLPANTSGVATVTRTGGPTEALMVQFSVSGTGCTPSSGGIMMNAGTSQTIGFTIGGAGSTCTITIGAPSGHTSSPSNVNVVVQSTTQPPPGGGTAPEGCPAIPTSSLNRTGALPDFQTVDQLKMASTVIAYYPVPAPPNAMSVIVEYSQTQMANTPASVITEFQVSKCPGVWDPPGHSIAEQCRHRGTFANINNMKIWTSGAGQYQSQANLPAGNCFAPRSTGQYYINVRWTYPSCPYPEGCGFSNRWLEWASNSP